MVPGLCGRVNSSREVLTERFFFHRDSEGGPLGSQGDPILSEMVQNQLILKDLDG